MAVASPENSPESKPKTKRGRPRRTAKPSEEDDSPGKLCFWTHTEFKFPAHAF